MHWGGVGEPDGLGVGDGGVVEVEGDGLGVGVAVSVADGLGDVDPVGVEVLVGDGLPVGVADGAVVVGDEAVGVGSHSCASVVACAGGALTVVDTRTRAPRRTAPAVMPCS